MAKAKQLTVSCENRPGTLAHVARVLGDGVLPQLKLESPSVKIVYNGEDL
jgi:hypothetical protein